MCLVFAGPSDAVLCAGVSGPVAALGRPVHAAGEQAADGAGQQLGRAGEGRRHGLAAGETGTAPSAATAASRLQKKTGENVVVGSYVENLTEVRYNITEDCAIQSD